MRSQHNNIKHSTTSTKGDSSKAVYHAPILTVLGEASKLTKGNENATACDALAPGHGADPCS